LLGSKKYWGGDAVAFWQHNITKMCVIRMYDWNRKEWIIRYTTRHKTEIPS
jgi:hypothetical protein